MQLGQGLGLQLASNLLNQSSQNSAEFLSASANNAAEAFVIDTSWDSATSNTQPDPSDAFWEVTFPERYI